MQGYNRLIFQNAYFGSDILSFVGKISFSPRAHERPIARCLGC